MSDPTTQPDAGAIQPGDITVVVPDGATPLTDDSGQVIGYEYGSDNQP